MKLYTEKQVLKAIQETRYYSDLIKPDDVILKELIPIELPSEEKIEKEAVYFSDSLSIYDTAKDDTLYGFREGAKWVIEQIKKQK